MVICRLHTYIAKLYSYWTCENRGLNSSKHPSKPRMRWTGHITRKKAKYFKDQLSEITTTKAYWNLLTKVRKSIEPQRRDDKSIAVEYSEKANLMNEFFDRYYGESSGQFLLPVFTVTPSK